MLQMLRVVLATLLFTTIICQPKCSSSGMPHELPALLSQHLVLDLNRHFQGPNLTLSLQSNNSQITLLPKYNNKQQMHNIGKILQIATSLDIITMLGVSSTGQFYIYYASITNPNNIYVKQIPTDLTRCTNHALSPNAQTVAITCQNKNRTKYILAYTNYKTNQTWNILTSNRYAASINRQIQYINSIYVGIIIGHQFNSYIQLWDIRYQRIVGIYDRTFFGLVYMKIVDVQMTAGSLYILEYQTGIYQLKLNFNQFYIEQLFQFKHYQKMAVYFDNFVVAKKGSVTEFSRRNVFKYDVVGVDVIDQIIISQEYIITFTQSQTIVYLLGLNSPYLTIPFRNQFVAAIFLTNTKLIQTVSLSTTQIKLQQLTLNYPQLTIPSSIPTNTSITITAVSQINNIQQRCKMQFVLVRTNQNDMQIFDSQYNRNGTQNIYMNRPGSAYIDLSPYGMGPNLHYQVQIYAQTVNLTSQVRKVRRIQDIDIRSIEKLKIKAAYFSDSCGKYKNICPLSIDTVQNQLKFYQCSINNKPDDYGTVHKINCTQRYTQYKQSQYIHYQLQYTLSSSQYFYQISVLQSNQHIIIIRKFQISTYYQPILTIKYKISQQNKYGQNNITQLQYNQQNNLLYVLLTNRKQIYILQLLQNGEQLQVVQRMRINREILDGRYFSPKTFQMDSDGRMWVKNVYEIIILDFRQLQYQGKPKVISSIDIDIANKYDYGFKIVEDEVDSQLFQPDLEITIKAKAQSKIKNKTKHNRKHNPKDNNSNKNIYNSNNKISQTIKSLDLIQRNRRYLIIYSNEKLLMCPIDHLYNTKQKLLQNLPLYSYKLPQDRNQFIIQSLGNSQLFISLLGNGSSKIGMIYNLDSLSLASVYYASIQTKISAIPAYFHLTNTNPVIIYIQQIQNFNIISAYQISQKPKILFTLNQMLGETQSQFLLIQVFNQKQHIRHTVILGISNSAQNLTKGSNYPYPNSRVNAIDRYIEINTKGWVDGNVLNISYVCDRCTKPKSQNQNQPYVDVKGKLWTKHEYNVAGGQYIQIVVSGHGQIPYIAIIRNNMLYTFDYQTKQIASLHQLTQSSTDVILSIKYHQQKRILLAAIRNQYNKVSLVTYSISNYKGFQLTNIILPSSIQYILNMQFKGNVAILLDFSNIYIVSVDNFGICYLVDYLNQIQTGGTVCWVQLLQPIDNQVYTIIVTLCQSGITYFTFKLQNMAVLTIISKQTLDLKANLNTFNIRMPTDSTFRRSVSKVRMNKETNNMEISLLMVIRNFNSYQWLLSLKNKVVIYQAKIVKVIHRYENFGATEMVSIGGTQGRFMTMTYQGSYDNVSKYIHAVYDLQDTHPSKYDQKFQHCYIMQSFATLKNARPQYFSNRSLLVLSDDAHHIKQIDTDNKFRAVIHNENSLYSQSLFMIPYTPVSSIKIQIYIKGIDLVVWQVWQILILVFFGLVGFGISIFFIKLCVEKYRRDKKLVPLLVDYAEYEEDLAEEFQDKKRKTSQGLSIQQVQDENQIIQGNINRSDRGSVPL